MTPAPAYPGWGAGRRRPDWGDGLKACRRRAGLSRRALAARTGLSAAFLNRLEGGAKPFNACSIDRILEAIGVTLADVQAARDALPIQIVHRAPPPWPWWAERRDASARLRRVDAAVAAARRDKRRDYMATYMAAYARRRRAAARQAAASRSTNGETRVSMSSAWRPSASPTTSATP